MYKGETIKCNVCGKVYNLEGEFDDMMYMSYCPFCSAEISHPYVTKVMGLCEGRHEIPEVRDGYIYPNTLNPLDEKGMMEMGYSKIKDVNCLHLYVTGLTVALVTIINICRIKHISLTLYHYDINSKTYFTQELIE